MKKNLLMFLICWVVFIIIISNTGSKDLEPKMIIVYSGACAGVFLIMYWAYFGGNKKSKDNNPKIAKKIKDISSELYIFEGEFGRNIVYRINDGKIYNGMSNRYDYEIKDNIVYKALSSHVVFRLEGNLVYKDFERKATYRIEKNKIYAGEFGRVPIYRICTSINS